MVYTKDQFGKDLMAEVNKGYDTERIAKWADKLYYDNSEKIVDLELDKLIQNIASMSFGEQFIFTKDELIKLAKSLTQN